MSARRGEDEPTRRFMPEQPKTASVRTPVTAPTSESPRASRARARGSSTTKAAPARLAASFAETETTAEIPVVDSTTARPRRAVELDDGTLWYPGVSKRLPAPFWLRVFVWLLFFALLVGLAGLAVERYHPGWLAIFRKVSPSGVTTASTAGSSQGVGGAGLRRVRSTSRATTYAVAASSFSIVLVFDHPCWTRIASPAGSSHDLIAQTLPASASPEVVKVRSSASVYLGASTQQIAITSAGRTLGVVQAPRVGHSYDFISAASGGS
jgi:hypothetical protein